MSIISLVAKVTISSWMAVVLAVMFCGFVYAIIAMAIANDKIKQEVKGVKFKYEATYEALASSQAQSEEYAADLSNATKLLNYMVFYHYQFVGYDHQQDMMIFRTSTGFFCVSMNKFEEVDLSEDRFVIIPTEEFKSIAECVDYAVKHTSMLFTPNYQYNFTEDTFGSDTYYAFGIMPEEDGWKIIFS